MEKDCEQENRGSRAAVMSGRKYLGFWLWFGGIVAEIVANVAVVGVAFGLVCLASSFGCFPS